ncbi:alpha-galactosidase [Sphingorhabdus sp.]|uniref:alpha-galactosidase n=1 Tax=Sphingorhabdus sp. TaxID=1902408 RepID=UPI003BB0707C
MTEYLRLDSAECTLILELPQGEAPLWRYWGLRLPDGVLPPQSLRETRPTPSFSPDFDQPLSVFPGCGAGWFGESALLAHRDVRDWSFQATQCRVEQADGSATVTVFDEVSQIEVIIGLTLNAVSNVLAIETKLTNQGNAPLNVKWLAAGVLPLPPEAAQVHSYCGRHNGEFVPVTYQLSRSTWRRENRRGLTSHDRFPGALVEANGATYGAQLAWSGNHAQSIEWIDDGRFQWQFGEWLAPGEVRLAPGECLTTPELLATCAHDADRVAQNFHAAIRQRLTWPGGAMKPRPVHINTWEGFYFEHDEDALKDLADHAAALGIERFVLDDGWFHCRDDDSSSLGDWWPDARKYPNGLKPLTDHVTGLGMEFGLWIEPEMVNPDSELYRAHPEWALGVSGRAAVTARNQLVLDMRRAEVRSYLFDCVAALLRELPISYLKWDHNRDLIAAGDRAGYRDQVLGSYALMEQLRAEFPDVEIEACAGGGGRIDAGIVRHTHRFWTSDNIDAVSRLSIQRGFLQYFPPELMGAHVGASPAHATGRQQSMDFRAGVALPGHFGVELDVRTLGESDRAQLQHWISLYKTHRDRLHSGKVWRGEAGDGLYWQAYGEADNLLLLVYRIEPQSWRHAPLLKLPILDAKQRYHIDGTDYDGAWLISTGLPTKPLKAEQFLLIEVKAI